MSWIAGLADKAENILNKLDQNAATALQISTNDINSQASSFKEDTPALLQSVSSKLQVIKNSSPLKIRYKSIGAGITSTDGDKSKNSSAMDSVNIAINLESQNTSSQDILNSRADVVAIDIGEKDAIHVVQGKNVDITEPTEENKTGVNSTEYKQELMAFKIGLAEVSKERDNLKLLLNALNNDTEISALRQRVRELEAISDSLTSENHQIHCRLAESQSSCAEYMQSILELESHLSKLKQEYIDVTKKLQMQVKETEVQRQHLQEYRTKAQRALQMKDNLIAEIKGGITDSGAVTRSGEENNDVRLLQMELDTLRNVYQNSHEENSNLIQQLQQAEADLKASKEMHLEMLASIRLTEAEMRKTLKVEKEQFMQVESENRILTQELSTLRQQLSNHLAASATCLHERDQLIQKLKLQEKGRDVDAELYDGNMRIKSLTQSLLDKQNTLEAITADRNALRIQLEKLQDQLQQKIYHNNNNSNSQHRNALLSNSTDDVKAQFPALMRESPFDNRVSRRVKRAYSSLDSAGIRLGAFLRRYPLLRVFVLMYVGLLHMWVIFVLLSSTPT